MGVGGCGCVRVWVCVWVRVCLSVCVTMYMSVNVVSECCVCDTAQGRDSRACSSHAFACVCVCVCV